MSMGVLLAVQAGIMGVMIIVSMFIYILRLRKNVVMLKDVLQRLRDDLGGASLITQLQESGRETVAACSKETIVFNPEHEPQDQAIALRAAAIDAEIRVIEARQAGKISLQAALAPYLQLAQGIHAYLAQMRENLKGQAAADYQHRITELQRQLEALNRKYKALEDTQKRMRVLLDLLESQDQASRSKDQMEQALHQALAAMCESYREAVAIREIIYLYHEAYFDRLNGGPAGQADPVARLLQTDTGSPAAGDTGMDAGSEASAQLDMLFNILDEQKQLVTELQNHLLHLDASAEREEIEEKTDALQLQVQDARSCLETLETVLKNLAMNGGSSSAYDAGEMMDLIEQFTEESAQMVERLHMLTNQNKMLTTENEGLRQQMDNSVDSDRPMVAGLTARIQQQADEILTLQASYKKLEEQYLTLYASTQG